MALDPTIPLKVLTPGDIQEQQDSSNLSRVQTQIGKQSLQKGLIGLSSDQLDLHMKKNDAVIQLLQGANDQNSWNSAIQQAQSMGLPTDHVPQQFDPNVRNQLLKGAVDAKTQMTAQAMAAWRGSQLDLKAHNTFENPDDAQSWIDDHGTPFLGGRRTSTSAPMPGVQNSVLGAAGNLPGAIPQEPMQGPPAPVYGPQMPPQQGPTQDGPPMSASAVANTPAGQDPLAVWKASVAAQGGISPATKPMDAAVLQQQPAAQIAATPVNQRFQTTSASRLHFQQQGGTQDAMIQSRMRNTGEDYATAASAIKNGIGQGNTVDANGNVVPRAGSLSSASQQAAAKGEGAGYGKELGAQMEEYRSQSEAAQGMDATLNAMKADAEKFRMGAMSDMQGTAKSYLQALAQGLGVATPEMDANLGAQQAFTKSAMGLVMGGMQKVQGRAFGEMKAIQSAFPTQAMSKNGFDLVVNQIEGSNQYAEAKYQAASDYRQKNGSLDGFENDFQKKVSPWAYVVKNMDGAQLTDLRNNLSKTEEGQKELKMLADQIRYAKTNGYMQ